MSKTKTISELVIELQKENDSLQTLKRLFNQAVKSEFGYDVKMLHQIVKKHEFYERKKAEREAQQQGQHNFI